MDRAASKVGRVSDEHAAVPGAPPMRHSRRLFDRLLIAFHHACDLGDFEIATELLRVLEAMATRRPRLDDGDRRRSLQGLVAAHERLWYLRRSPMA